MAIRFQCAACSEPIEVDNEWAHKVVRCPYCQRTVTAPTESTLPSAEQIPMATAVAGPRNWVPASDPVGAAGAVPPPPLPATNKAATAALILAFAAVGLLVLAMRTISTHALEWQEILRNIEEAQSQNKSPTAAMMKYFESQGGQVPGWMAAFIVYELSALGAWLASVVLGILGLFRPVRQGMAIAALVVAGLLCVMFCISSIAGGM